MLILKTSIAAAILAGTVTISAGASYLVTKATMKANVTANCPATAPTPAQPRAFPPLGNVPSTTGGKQW